MRGLSTGVLLLGCVAAGGCSTSRYGFGQSDKAVAGGMIGSVAGAGAAAVTGGVSPVVGAVAGAAVGAAVGAVAGSDKEQAKRDERGCYYVERDGTRRYDKNARC